MSGDNGDNKFKIYIHFYSMIRWIEMDVPNQNYLCYNKDSLSRICANTYGQRHVYFYATDLNSTLLR